MTEFAQWMRENLTLSESSIGKYSRAVRTISGEMLEAGVIHKSLSNMNVAELDIAINNIFADPGFIDKDTRGNHMYSCALKQFRMYRLYVRVPVTDNEIIKMIPDYRNIIETERTALIKSRIGQGLFKEKLMSKYERRCVMTGITLSRLLIASHVKPWAVSSNEERLSSENGLLLSPTYDKLFDSGLITFSDQGVIHISTQLDKENACRLQLMRGAVYDLKMSRELKKNMEYHRDVVFVK